MVSPWKQIFSPISGRIDCVRASDGVVTPFLHSKSFIVIHIEINSRQNEYEICCNSNDTRRVGNTRPPVHGRGHDTSVTWIEAVSSFAAAKNVNVRVKITVLSVQMAAIRAIFQNTSGRRGLSSTLCNCSETPDLLGVLILSPDPVVWQCLQYSRL